MLSGFTFWPFSFKRYKNKLKQRSRRGQDIVSAAYKLIAESAFFNASWYKNHYLSDMPDVDPVKHYLEEGFKFGYDPSELFSTEFYLLVNKDVYNAGINPLLHYEQYGKNEARRIAPASFGKDVHYPQSQKYSVLLISHELSLTGAPIALMNMAKILKDNGINPLILTTRGGKLEESLTSYHIDYHITPLLLFDLKGTKPDVSDFLRHFEVILFNTIDSLTFAEGISEISSARKILWVHEGDLGFLVNSKRQNLSKSFSYMDEIYSVGEYSKSFTDKYVDSGRSHILLYGLDSTDHITIPREYQKMRFGIFGSVNARKATNKFVEAVRELNQEVREQCEFFIVGALSESNYAREVRKSAEEIGITVTGELPHGETISLMKTIDVVVCPSEDDPMPIVCTEAMQLGKGLIVSDHTGTASFVDKGLQAYIYHLERDNLATLIERAYSHRDEFLEKSKTNIEIYRSFFSSPVFEKNILNIFTNCAEL
jgi:glycosyltransferase involved in cell wall biosynthesis